MKRLLVLMMVLGAFAFQASHLGAQEATPVKQAIADDVEPADTSYLDTHNDAMQFPEEEQSLHKTLKVKFIEGGPGFMTTILLTLIFGLAIAIERIIYLSLASVNNRKLLQNIESAIDTGGIEAAKEVCRNTRGPVASIFYQGLCRADEGLEAIEKSVIAYGSVQTGQLESGLTWIALFIGIAPMLGFMGTVVGMIIAFDNIEAAGDITPTLVASGIKIALITTVFGLIVAIILQILYNYLLTKIDKITNDMEDSSISLMDILVKYKLKDAQNVPQRS